MNRFAGLQLVGPAVVCAGLLACEAASRLLAYAPSSPIAWYLSEDLLGVLRSSRRLIDAELDFGQSPLLLIAFLWLLAACCGLVTRRRLMLALASNLNLIYVSFLLCTGCMWPLAGAAATASRLGWEALAVAALLAGASLVSSLAAHAGYLGAIRDEH